MGQNSSTKRSITYIYKNKCEAPGRQTYTYISTPQCELLFGSFLSGTTEPHAARDSLCNGDTVWWKFFTAVWDRIVASWHATVFSVSFHSLMKVFNVWDGQAQWNWRLETPSRASDGYAACQRVCVRLVSSWICCPAGNLDLTPGGESRLYEVTGFKVRSAAITNPQWTYEAIWGMTDSVDNDLFIYTVLEWHINKIQYTM